MATTGKKKPGGKTPPKKGVSPFPKKSGKKK